VSTETDNHNMKYNIAFDLNDVSFSYPYDEPVLKKISLKICEGEKLCVLGANGSGKSTLLKLMAGLIFPAEGTFRAFGGEIITEKLMSGGIFSREYHKKVGFIFQNSEAQLFCSTVREEVAFGPVQLRLPADEVGRRVEDLLDLLDIRHLSEKAPFKLSGGEKKKVALACTLALNPSVLILDEPTNGLDPRTQRWIAEILIKLNKSGKTVITATHNLELIQEIADRAVVFNEDHTIAADAPIEEVLRNVELLKDVNLVDEYYHMHGDQKHVHFHIHNY
jgi:cobalt/nickel transport system ATP-binding protein